MDYITLVGTEQVGNAAGMIKEAADRMQSAASQIEGALMRQERFMDEWLSRLESILQESHEEKD